MGEMLAYGAMCDMAFIGGSLLSLGGQNLIEACSLGKPVLIGEHTFNFEAITNDAIHTQAALRVKDAEDLMAKANMLLQDKQRQKQMSDQAFAFANKQRGATERTLQMLRPFISS